jgi:hypothetical protein
MTTPDLAFRSVGVAGFEPTASSSRSNPGAAVTGALLRHGLLTHPGESGKVRPRTWWLSLSSSLTSLRVLLSGLSECWAL